MIKKITTLTLLGVFLRYIRKDYTAHPFYNAGIIDEKGNYLVSKDNMTKEQLSVFSDHINLFTFKLKRIISANPILKYSIISALTSSIFLKESASKEKLVTEYKVGIFDNNYVIVHLDEYHQTHNAFEIINENGAFIVDANLVQLIDIKEEITNSVTGVASNPKLVNKLDGKKCKKILKRKALNKKNKKN